MSRSSTVLILASLWLASATVAGAQSVDTGTEVRVNPVTGPSNVLLYPGDQYMRVVPQLLQPGQTGAAIRLHMPSKHAARERAANDVVAEAAPAAPRSKPARKTAVAAAAPSAPEPPPDTSGYVSTLGGEAPQGAAGLFHYTGPPAPAAPSAKTQVARAEPAPVQTLVPGLSKESMILFAHDAADPAESALNNLKLLASQLNAKMKGPAARVEIQAYGGPKGDKSSDSRRLSLKRALAIRQVLIDDGVPSERINVHAMGGVDDSGPIDRVDVYVKA